MVFSFPDSSLGFGLCLQVCSVQRITLALGDHSYHRHQTRQQAVGVTLTGGEEIAEVEEVKTVPLVADTPST